LATAIGCLASAGDTKTSNTKKAGSDKQADTKKDSSAKNAPKKPAAPGPTSWASFRNGDQQLGVATSKLPEKLEVLWKVKTQDGVVATSAIVGDRVYVPGLSGDLLCLDKKNGKKVWAYRSIDDPDPKQFAPGFKSAPRVTANSVYVGDEDGVLHSVDRVTGKRRWKATTDAEIAGCAAVVGDKVIVGSHDNFLYCFNSKDGTLAWKFETQDRVNCSPAIVEKYTFVAGCDAHLRVIDIEDGKEVGDIPLESYLIASPAVMGDVLYVGNYGAEVLAVDWKKKQIVWRYKDPVKEFPIHASAAVTKKYVIVGGHDKQMHCIDRETGNGVWTFLTKGRIDSSAVIVGDRVFFGSADRNLYALSIDKGESVWTFNAGQSITAGPAVGENVLVVGCEGSGGFVYCFGKK
jgi:outer membrane protein assembly factor BamB